MNNIAQTRTLRTSQATKLETVFAPANVLPAVLAVNTVALLALDQLGGIPEWMKTAASLFLSF